MRARGKRLVIIGVAGVLLVAATALALTALRDAVVFFVGPGEAVERGVVASGERVRLGGLVEAGSVQRSDDGELFFAVTDGVVSLPVRYTGHVPDLFREGEGVIAEGRFGADAVFAADRVLARHDENYIPSEVKKTLEDTGHWRPDAGGYGAPGSGT